MKKVISLFLTFTMLALTLVTPAFSASALVYDGYSYEVHNNEVTITGYSTASPVLELHIPSVIDSMPVTAIDDIAFVNDTYISSFYLPSGLKTIGNGAFYACSAESIYLPDSLETIGENAFMNCNVLTSMSLGPNVSGITSSTFQGCERISSFTVSADNKNYRSIDGVLFSKDKKTLMIHPTGLKDSSYDTPKGVETIWSYAFYNCTSLKEISLPSSLKTVEECAFDSSSGLTKVIYRGTEEDWNKVSVSDTGNSYFVNADLAFDVNPEPCDEHTKSGEGTVKVAPTCTKKGSTEYVCSVCGLTFTEETEALGHDYSSVVTPPTCTEKGYTTYTCSRGDSTYKDDYTDALGHTPETLEAVAPTYFAKGKTEGEKCSVCGEILVPQKNVAKLVLAVPSKKKATPKTKAFVFTWKRNKNASGYIIQYSLKKDFSKKKTVKIKKNKTVKKTVKNLKAKKTYYIRIRALKKSGTKTAYSKWSKTVKVKTK